MEIQRGLITGSPNFRPPGFRLAQLTGVGAKGAGLLSLPSPNWYPPTLFIDPVLHRLVADGKYSFDQFLESPDRPRIAAAFKSLSKRSATGRLLIRSSAQSETIAARGAFDTIETSPLIPDIHEAIRTIWLEASTKADEEIAVGFVVQPLISTSLSGHLSNEHRISRESNRWLLEVGSSSTPWAVRGSIPATEEALSARNVPTMENALRGVARVLSDKQVRHHLEWVWDGNRVWIVQADPVPPLLGLAPGESWVPISGTRVNSSDLRVWRRVNGPRVDDLADWPKVRALDEFVHSELPVPELWALQGAEEVARLVAGEEQPLLLDDLELMCSGHIVVRTDLRGDSAAFYLPRTEGESEPAEVVRFMRETAMKLIADGAEAGDVCFLAHRFIRSRACAWTRATPNNQIVEIDGTWGLNDGLAWLPHDSTRVNVSTGEVRRSQTGKTIFYDAVGPGEWDFQTTPSEWIWRSSASEDQLRQMAIGARRLADNSGKPTSTMWFVNILGGADAECLPWFQFHHEEHAVDTVRVDPNLPRAVVTSVEDLESVAADESRPTILRLEPASAEVRGRPFLGEVINVAKKFGLVVELVGSPLAHPYYMLTRAGIAVTCVSAVGGTPQTSHNKLVRDHIVERIHENGEQAASFQVDGPTRERLLRRKLVEESIELLHADSQGAALDEMADVEEVLKALRKAMSVAHRDVDERRKLKRELRGGFEDGLVLVTTGGPEGAGAQQMQFPDMAAIPADVESRQVVQSNHAVSMSAIPPASGRTSVFEVRVGDQRVRVEYDGAQIHLRPTQSGPTAGQLRLPFE